MTCFTRSLTDMQKASQSPTGGLLLRTPVGFQQDGLNLSAWDTGSQHCLPGPLYKVLRFLPDLDSVKHIPAPWRACYPNFHRSSSCVSQTQCVPLFLLLSPFSLHSAPAPFAEPVSPQLFVFIFSNKLCHCSLLILFDSLLKMRRPWNLNPEGKASNPEPGNV